MNWTFFKKWDWFGHIIEATIMAIVVAVIIWIACAAVAPITFWLALLIGGFGSCQHYYGREKRDAEIRNHAQTPMLREYWPGAWSSDSRTDFFPVCAVYVLYLLTYITVLR